MASVDVAKGYTGKRWWYQWPYRIWKERLYRYTNDLKSIGASFFIHIFEKAIFTQGVYIFLAEKPNSGTLDLTEMT